MIWRFHSASPSSLAEWSFVLVLVGLSWGCGDLGVAAAPQNSADVSDSELVADTDRKASSAHAADGSTLSAAGSLQVTLGFDGFWKLGQLCPLQVRLGQELSARAAKLRVHTVDGDGVEVSYVRPFSTADDQSGSTNEQGQSEIWMPIRVGKPSSPIQVEVLGANDEELATLEVGEQASSMQASDQPFALALGSALGVEQLVRTNAARNESNFSAVVIDQADALPPHWLDYSAVDVLLIAAQDVELLEAIGTKWGAIDRWIRNGGGCVISLSPEVAVQLMNGEAATDADSEKSEGQKSLAAFARLLPGKVLGDGVVADPGSLESLVGTSDPLSRFSIARIEPDRGRVELAFSDTLSRSSPWWMTYAHGHGTIRLVCSDLDSEAFANWDDRRLLWETLIEPYFDRALLEGVSVEGQAGETSYLGYSDLVGQLRATLDVFDGVRVISFGQVSAALVAIVLLIGPVDYLLCVRWLKRPELSWWFAGGVLLVASAALAWFGGVVHADRVLVNTAQVLDVDAQTGQTAGTLWSHVYCGAARKLNITADAEQPETHVFLDWQGLPGSGLGGLNTQLSTDRGMPAYEIEISADRESKIIGVGIPTGGTKGISASWIGETELEVDFNLRELPGVDQLTGSFENPFEVDIRDSVIFYHNWFYRMKSRIPAGDQVVIASDTIPKDIARKLNERRDVDEKVSSRKWDPSDRGSIDRLLELIMFHKASTGTNYTSLQHRFQPLLDHSNLLETDYAILVGRLDRPAVSLDIAAAGGTPVKAEQMMNRVWFRMKIPVAKPRK